MIRRIPRFFLFLSATAGAIAAEVADAPIRAGVLPVASRAALTALAQRPGLLVDKEWFIWGGSCAKGADGRYHLYFDRWRRDNPRGMYGWLHESEIAHAVADSPAGPWTITGTVVTADKAAPADRWDAVNAHNAMIALMPGADGKVRYHLYFIANHDTRAGADDWWNHILGQRIALAVSDKPEGPFRRVAEPVCAPGGPAHLYVVNPGVCRLPDGRYLMVFKSRDSDAKNSRMIHLWALADRPEGPFRIQSAPLFPADMLAEDPCVWVSGGRVHAAVKDWRGQLSGTPGIARIDGDLKPGGVIAWSVPKDALIAPRVLRWSDGSETKLDALERPFVLCDERGTPVRLFAAAAVGNPFVNGSQKPRKPGTPPVPDKNLPFNVSLPIEAKRRTGKGASLEKSPERAIHPESRS